MTLEEALNVLADCDWLKITQRHVSASKNKTRDEIHQEMYFCASHAERLAVTYRRADVSIRRKKTESFTAFMVRAAQLVSSGHLPTARVPPMKSSDACACGIKAYDLIWNEQMKQRVCRRCDAAWTNASTNNDMKPLPQSDTKTTH